MSVRRRPEVAAWWRASGQRELREGGGVPEVRDVLASALSSMGMGLAGPREDEVAQRILSWWTASSPRG